MEREDPVEDEVPTNSGDLMRSLHKILDNDAVDSERDVVSKPTHNVEVGDIPSAKGAPSFSQFSSMFEKEVSSTWSSKDELLFQWSPSRTPGTLSFRVDKGRKIGDIYVKGNYNDVLKGFHVSRDIPNGPRKGTFISDRERIQLTQLGVGNHSDFLPEWIRSHSAVNPGPLNLEIQHELGDTIINEFGSLLKDRDDSERSDSSN